MLLINNNHKKSIEFLDSNLLGRVEQVDGLVLFSRRQLASAKVPRVCRADVHRVKLAVAPHVMSLTSLKTKEIGLEQQKPMCVGFQSCCSPPFCLSGNGINLKKRKKEKRKNTGRRVLLLLALASGCLETRTSTTWCCYL
jgi:hypothetical protein